MTAKQAAYLESLRTAYPDLAITTVEFEGFGQNSDVLIVDSAWIFRFPKYPHVLERLKTETAILKAIHPRLPLAVPVPEYVHLKGQAVGQAFVGYRKIPGEPLWRETFRAIGDEEKLEALAGQLGGFLKALHSVPVGEAIACDLRVDDTEAAAADLYARIREKLFPYMRPDACAWAAGHFETFLDDPANFDYEPVLKHSDFGTSNILYDARAQRITGIIDFGSSCLGDPAYDFAGLLSSYGESFVLRCGRAYPKVGSFLGRIRFYQGTFALLEALFGVENDDEDAFEAGMAQYV